MSFWVFASLVLQFHCCIKSHGDVVLLEKLRLHENFKRLKITHNFKIIIYNPSQFRYQQILHFLCVSERRDCLPQGLKQRPVDAVVILLFSACEI